MNTPEDPLVWVPRLSRGELSAEEAEALKAWTQASPENEKAFQEALLVWEASEQHTAFEPAAEPAWDALKGRLGQAAGEKEAPVRKRGFDQRWLRIAAALVVALGASWFLLTREGGERENWAETVTQMEKSGQEVLLADGTKVWLNKSSTLRYPSSFDGSTREVELQGEAFFEVAKNPEKPFIIHTENSATQVLGTSFNLRAYPGEETVEVVVATGKVALRNEKDKSKTVTLTPGELGVFNRESGKVVGQANEDPNFLSWKSDELAYDNTDLNLVKRSLERHFSITVDLDGEALEQCRFSSEFKKPALEEVLRVLAATLDLDYELRGDRVTLHGQGC